MADPGGCCSSNPGFYGLLLAFVPAPGVPLWAGVATIGRVLPEHWGTVICTLPTISTTILGMLLGELLMTPRSAKNKMAIIALTGLACVVLGWALNPVIPIIMKVWTTSYGLASAGWVG